MEQKGNVICPVGKFYCAGIVMLEAFGKFWNSPPRVTDDARAGRRDPQTAAEEVKSQYR